MSEWIENLLPCSRFERPVYEELEARGGSCHFQDDLVWGQTFYESVFDRLALTPAQLDLLDGDGLSLARHRVRTVCETFAKSGHFFNADRCVWELTNKPSPYQVTV